MIRLIVDPASDFSREEARARGMILIPIGGQVAITVSFRQADRR